MNVPPYIDEREDGRVIYGALGFASAMLEWITFCYFEQTFATKTPPGHDDLVSFTKRSTDYNKLYKFTYKTLEKVDNIVGGGVRELCFTWDLSELL